MREGVYSFGAPVFGASGEAVAAISVCINKAQLGSRPRRPAIATPRLAVAADLSRRHRRRRRPARRSRRGGMSAARGGDNILETRGLTKEFKGFVAVNDVNLQGAARHASTR